MSEPPPQSPQPPQSLETLLRLDGGEGPATSLDAAALDGQVQQVLARHAAQGPAAATTAATVRRPGRVVMWTLAAAVFTSAAAAMVLRTTQMSDEVTGETTGEATNEASDSTTAAEPEATAGGHGGPSAVRDLLAEANRRRGAADYAGALSLYMRVGDSTQDPLSAHVALVAAADLELEQRRDPQRAKALYARALALRPDGPVAPEARRGLQRALQQLDAPGLRGDAR